MGEGQPSWYIGLALDHLAESPRLTTFIFPPKPRIRYLRTSVHFIPYT